MSAGVIDLRQSENNAIKGVPGSFFTGQGRDSNSSKNQSKVKGKIKSGIVFTLFMGMLTAGGFFLTSSNLSLAGALSANITKETSLQDVISAIRSRKTTKMMLEGEDMVTTSWTGAKKYTTLPKKYKDRLEKNGIEVKGSGKNLTLVYNGKKGKEEISADQFINKLNSDVDFLEDYQKSRRSNIANFFDTAATNFYKRFDARNWWRNYREGSDEKENKKNYQDTGSKHFDGSESGHSSSGKMKQYDEEGNLIGEEWEPGEEGSTSSGSSDKAEAESKARSYMADVSSKISDGLSDACGFMRIGNMISISVEATDKINYMKYFLGQIESVSKMMAGEGSNSPINQVLNFLTTPSTIEVDDVRDIKLGSGGRTETGKLTTTGAPIEASGLQLLVSNIKTNAASAAPYATNRTGSAVARALELSGKTTAACGALDIGTSLFSIATTITPGVGEIKIIASLAVKAIGENFIDYFVNKGVETILGFLIPFIAQSLVSNMFEDLTGIPAGHAFASGGSIAGMWLSRTGSGLMPSSSEKVQKFARAQDTVIAMNAEIDRKNHSPFDITSQNTFLGSIVNSLLPTIYSTRISSITALTKSTASSIASLTSNTVLADTGENQRYIDTHGEDCSRLNGIGATGDLYCNDIDTSDMSTKDVLPNDPNYAKFMATQTENCDAEGNCEIIEDSTVDRFIKYCVNRQSPFGVLDSNILDEFAVTSKDGLLGKLLDFLGNLPVLEDIWAIADAISADTNPEALAWASGEKCVNNDSDSWNNEMKYAQLYVTDQRILEQDGAYEEGQNPVEMAYDRYLEKHPLDESAAGTLARISGIRKDDAQLVLDIVAYYNFLQDYDPSTRIAMTGDTSEIKTSTDVALEAHANQNRLDRPQPTDEATTVIALVRPTIVYADLRTRSHTV